MKVWIAVLTIVGLREVAQALLPNVRMWLQSRRVRLHPHW